MLWVDKYRPHTLDKVMVHVQEAQHLKNLVPAQLISPLDSSITDGSTYVFTYTNLTQH